jgi:hypothetical protein
MDHEFRWVPGFPQSLSFDLPLSDHDLLNRSRAKYFSRRRANAFLASGGCLSFVAKFNDDI